MKQKDTKCLSAEYSRSSDKNNLNAHLSIWNALKNVRGQQWQPKVRKKTIETWDFSKNKNKSSMESYN